jgi:hypothetical protein
MYKNEHYMIITSSDSSVLTNRVNNMIVQGWLPTGGICLEGGKLLQAMWMPPLSDVTTIKMQAATSKPPITK